MINLSLSRYTRKQGDSEMSRLFCFSAFLTRYRNGCIAVDYQCVNYQSG